MKNSTMIVLDPTDESTSAHREAIARPSTLDGLRIGLLDISKPRGDVLLDRLEVLLAGRGVAGVRRYAKPTYAKPLPPDLRREIAAECDVVISALAD